MPKSSQTAPSVPNLPVGTDVAALHAYIDHVVNQRIASIAAGVRSPLGGAPRDNLEDSDGDEYDNIAGPAEDGVLEDSDDESLPPLVSRSPSLSGVDTELANAIRQTMHISSPTGSLSPTSSNLVPAQVRDAVLRAMAKAPPSGGDVQAILTPGDTNAQPVPQAFAPQPAAQASDFAPAAQASAQSVAPVLNQLPATAPPPPTTIPAARPLILGFHSLAGTPAPVPAEAVFAGPDDGPFYAVTRGIRIGVIGGWETVSPYVIGVSGAIFKKHPSRLAAYKAYHHSYYQLQNTKYL